MNRTIAVLSIQAVIVLIAAFLPRQVGQWFSVAGFLSEKGILRTPEAAYLAGSLVVYLLSSLVLMRWNKPRLRVTPSLVAE